MPPARQTGDDNETHQSQPHVFNGSGYVIMIVAIVIMIVVVMVVTVPIRIIVVTVVCDLASRINCFARRFHDEESGYFKYLLMTSISSSPAAAAAASFWELDCKRCRRTCPSRISAINAFMAPRQAARVSNTSPHSRSSFRAFSMPLICPRMRLILANSFFLFWMTWAMMGSK